MTIDMDEFERAFVSLKDVINPPDLNGNWVAIMHPDNFLGFYWLKIMEWGKKWFYDWVWSKWRRRLWPRLTRTEQLLAFQLYVWNHSHPELVEDE